MSHRQTRHHGASTGDERELPGRDVPGPETVGADSQAAAEDARDVSRLIDENEGRTPGGERRDDRGTTRREDRDAT